MLVLTRKPGEAIRIGDSVSLTILEVRGNQVRVGIEAPDDVVVYREEVFQVVLEQNRSAASIEDSVDLSLDEYWGGIQGNEGSRKGTDHDHD